MIFRALILASVLLFGCSSDDFCSEDSAVDSGAPVDIPVDTPVDTDPAVDSAV
jgi:hypothetical protein